MILGPARAVPGALLFSPVGKGTRHPAVAAIARTDAFRELVGNLPGPGEEITAGGAIGSLSLAAVAALARRLPSRLWVVTASSPREAEEHMGDLTTLMGPEAVAYYPQRERSSPDKDNTHAEFSGQRVEAVESLLAGRARVLVATERSLQEVAPIPDELAQLRFTVAAGQQLGRDVLINALNSRGFKRAPVVEEIGQYAVRGGLIDFFSFGSAGPARVEFRGDEVASTRLFDILDQRSTEPVEHVDILPIDFRRGAEPGRATPCSLLNRLTRDTTLVRTELSEWEDAAETAWRRAKDGYEEDRHHGNPGIAPETLFLNPREFFTRAAGLPGLVFAAEPIGEPVFPTLPPPPVERDVRRLRSFLADAAKEAAETLILCDNAGQAARLEELVSDRRGTVPRNCHFVVGSLSAGFRLRDPALRVNVLTDHEIFRRKRRIGRGRRFRGAASLESLAQLSPGDYVVHMDHGIGRFQGLERMVVGGEPIEVMVIAYDRDELLRVPVHRLDQVERWIGADPDARPVRVHRIGGKRWKALKENTETAIHQMTAELLELYAARQSRIGHAFPQDTRWQREMEASFLYEDTPDQRLAVEAIKKDMESPKVMDRLVCGDVGYGKTEVAIRAAFKAVQDGKQVAVLAPTTVLVAQHARTFGERLADYPVRTASLSRFDAPSLQRKVVKALRDGSLDIVIGTHRLISGDVGFKDLGLVIIDEEQRLGVRQKERLKRLRAMVDVLTLSATPIPRTLYMSLAGIRDLSLIRTPPRDRMPVVTHVVPWSDHLISEACRHELDRGGQVFFLHNRVQTIDTIRERVRRLVHPATVDVAHGQMGSRMLDRVMTRFTEGDTDVLVCSSIIENGLDVANANTLIVDRADRFGLSQLYQIRGRVGRSDRRAYCYLIAPDAISPDAEKRLRVLEHYTELGSGYQIALRDLEVRGAGNLLGEDQSGFAHAVGLDTYLRLVEQTVQRLREGKNRTEYPRPEVTMDVGAYLPDEYVADSRQKLHLYRRLSKVSQRGEIEDLAEEMTDRFGRLPAPARRLLDQFLLGIAGRRAGADHVLVREHRVRVNFRAGVMPRVSALEEALNGERVSAQVRRVAPFSIVFECYDPERTAAVVVRALDALGTSPHPDRDISHAQTAWAAP